MFFKYGNHSGYIKIKDYIIEPGFANKLLIEINGKEGKITPDNLLNLKIGTILGIFTYDFKYDVGYIFGKNNHKLKVISQYKTYKRMYSVKCLMCGYERDIEEYKIDKNYGCPICSNFIIVAGKNDMHTTNPKLAAMLYNSDDGYKYSQHSKKKLIWKCPVCNLKTKPLSPDYIYRHGLRCQKCGDGFSYPNKFVFNLLTKLNIKFIPEKSFEWSNNKRYDFYLQDYNYIIEAHGIQHYSDVYFSKLDEVYQNDIYKEKLALENGIKKYIVVDCRYSNADYIFHSICNSDLKDIIDISKIDVNEIDAMCQKNVLKDIMILYEHNYDINAISDILNISYSHISKSLKKANCLGLLKYDKNRHKNEYTQKIHKSLYQNNAKPIKCVDNGCVFGNYSIAEKNSVQIFGRKIHYNNICRSIKGNRKTFGYKFVFITRDEFNSTKTQYPNLAFGDYFELPYPRKEVV